MNFRCIVSIVLMLGVLGGGTSCERVLDVPGLPYKRQLVLVGLLQPDSLMSIQLLENAPANQTGGYTAVGQATVSFFENEQLVGEVSQQATGRYRISRRPRAGAFYRVVALVPGYGSLEASDTLPVLTPADLSSQSAVATNPNDNPDFVLTWQPNRQTGVYWVSAYVRQSRMVLGPGCPPIVNGGLPPGCSFIEQLETTYNHLLTNSLYPDRFSAVYDSFSGRYFYGGLVRVAPETLLDRTISLDFTLNNQIPEPGRRKAGEGLLLDFYKLGPQYDRYLKTAVQAYQNRIGSAEDLLANPFIDIAPVYTNVKNGQGIFGAMNRQRFRY